MKQVLVYLLGVFTRVVVAVPVLLGTIYLLGRELASDMEPMLSGELSGAFVCARCVYESVEFRDGGRAVVTGMGMAFPTTYTRVGDRVYVNTNQGDLGFLVVDVNTLEGEGWASGTYSRR